MPIQTNNCWVDVVILNNKEITIYLERTGKKYKLILPKGSHYKNNFHLYGSEKYLIDGELRLRWFFRSGNTIYGPCATKPVEALTILEHEVAELIKDF